MFELILLRHGQSQWNLENLFTGWHDIGLTDKGMAEAKDAGTQMVAAGVVPDVLYTSVQKRSIATANAALDVMNLSWLPVSRHWRLNERHYGALQGLNKKAVAEQYGEEQLFEWRRSYDVPPPPVTVDDPRHPSQDPRYADLAPDVIPATECLKDVGERVLPYWHDVIVPDLRSGKTVLVVAHGNSLRALAKHLEGMTADEITKFNIPTGVPRRYMLDGELQLDSVGYLGDADAIAAAADAVANQAK